MAIDAPPQIDALPEPRPDRFGGAQFDNQMQAWLSQFPIWTDQHEALGQWSYATALELALLTASATDAATTATTKAGQAAASAGAAQIHSDTTLGYRNEANASKNAAAASATAANTSKMAAADAALAAASSAASIAGGPVASWAGLTGSISESQAWAKVRSAVLSGLSTATSTAVVATDSLIVAIGKLVAGLVTKFDKAGGTLTGDVVITRTEPVLTLSRDAPSGYATLALAAGSARWWTLAMDAGAAGHFAINRYSDAGAYLATALILGRNNGDMTVGAAAWKPGGGSWSDTSDARTKQNIKPWTFGLSEIMQLKVRSWNFREETGRDVSQLYVGLVAQEAELVAPRLVSKRAGALGTMEFDDLRGVDPSDLVYMLVNGMQEQQRTIEGLQVRIAALESKQ